MYWEEFETLPRFELEKLQVERLKKTFGFASQSPFYGELFKQKGVSENSIKNVEDVRNLPFTTKQDLGDNFPYGFLVSSQACPITPSLDLFAPGCFKKSLQNAAMRGFLCIAGNKNIFDLTDISYLTWH